MEFYVLLHCVWESELCVNITGVKLLVIFYKETRLPSGTVPGVSFGEGQSLLHCHLGTSWSVIAGSPMLRGCLALNSRRP